MRLVDTAASTNGQTIRNSQKRTFKTRLLIPMGETGITRKIWGAKYLSQESGANRAHPKLVLPLDCGHPEQRMGSLAQGEFHEYQETARIHQRV